jgi:predicted DNA-binding transcriptional regulator YafY
MMTLLLHLQARGHCGGKDLARVLEVSERTVQRDVEALVATVQRLRGRSAR